MHKKHKEIKIGSSWTFNNGVTKGFITITRKQNTTLHYKHTDDQGYIHNVTFSVSEDNFLKHFKEI